MPTCLGLRNPCRGVRVTPTGWHIYGSTPGEPDYTLTVPASGWGDDRNQDIRYFCLKDTEARVATVLTLADVCEEVVENSVEAFERLIRDGYYPKFTKARIRINDISPEGYVNTGDVVFPEGALLLIRRGSEAETLYEAAEKAFLAGEDFDQGTVKLVHGGRRAILW